MEMAHTRSFARTQKVMLMMWLRSGNVSTSRMVSGQSIGRPAESRAEQGGEWWGLESKWKIEAYDSSNVLISQICTIAMLVLQCRSL